MHFRHMEQSNKLQDIVFTMDSYHSMVPKWAGVSVILSLVQLFFVGCTASVCQWKPLLPDMSLFPYDMSLWLYFLRHAQKQRSPSTSGVSAGEEFKVEYRAFSGRPWQVFVEHDIGIGGVVIHPCGKCGPAGSLEGLPIPGCSSIQRQKSSMGDFPEVK